MTRKSEFNTGNYRNESRVSQRKTNAQVFLPTTVNAINDVEGLNKAYSLPNRIYIDPYNKAMYIAGTSTATDVWDDLKIPNRNLNKSWRYEIADQLLQRDNEIKEIVGHSLGGSVALELQQRHPERQLRTITYGAPVASSYNKDEYKNSERYRNDYDPISILDRNAKSGPGTTSNPHTYSNFTDHHSGHDTTYIYSDYT